MDCSREFPHEVVHAQTHALANLKIKWALDTAKLPPVYGDGVLATDVILDTASHRPTIPPRHAPAKRAVPDVRRVSW